MKIFFRAALVTAWAALAVGATDEASAQDSTSRQSSRPAHLDSADSQRPRFFFVRAENRARIDARNASVLQRQESLSLLNVPLGTAVRAIADRAGLEVTFSNELIAPHTRVSIKADDITVAAALTRVLSHTNFDVLISEDRHLTLVPRVGQEASVDSSSVLTGSLTDADDEQPIPYATVAILGTDRIGHTDAHGRFLFPGLTAKSTIVRATQIGYASADTALAVLAGPAITTATIRLRRIPEPLQPVEVQARAPAPPALQAWMFASIRSDLHIGLSDSAYVAMFEIFPGRGVELLYPAPYDADMHAAGEFYIHPAYLRQGEEEREIAFTGRPYTGFPPCYLLIASRSPLHVSRYTTHALALSEALHEEIPSIDHPLVVLGTILRPGLPADTTDWASDMYCEPGYQLAGLDPSEIGLPIRFLNAAGFASPYNNSFALGALAWGDVRFGDPDVRYCYPWIGLESAVPRSVCRVQMRALEELVACPRSPDLDTTGCRPVVLSGREPQQQPMADTARSGAAVARQPARIPTVASPVSAQAAPASGDRGSTAQSRGSGDGRVSSRSVSGPSNTSTSNGPSSGGASRYGGGAGFGSGVGGGGNGSNAGSYGGGRPGARP